jgi:uncharacterized membrane protein
MESISGGGTQPRVVEAGRGLGWWTDAWTLFMRNPGMWVVFGLIVLVIMFVLGVVPILGGLAASLLMPVFFGSWMQAARKLQSGGALEVGDLFSAFKTHLNPLLVLGALLLAAMVVMMVFAGVMGMGAALGVGLGSARGSAGGLMAGFGLGMVAMLLMVVVSFLVGMAMWFAPALVVFDNLAPVEAAKASFAASLKNLVPFLLFGVLYIVAAVVASIPFGLGWVVLVPLVGLCAYVSYQDVFA